MYLSNDPLTGCPADHISSSRETLLLRYRKSIPDTMHGLHICGVLRFGFDLFAYTSNVDVHAARCNRAIVAPDAIEQVVPREHHARMCGQVVQQSKLQSAEFDVTSRNVDSMRGWIDVYIPVLSVLR